MGGGSVYLNVQFGNGYEYDCVLHCVIWMYSIYLAEINNAISVYINQYCDKSFEDLFVNKYNVTIYSSQSKCYESNVLKKEFTIKSLSQLKSFKSSLQQDKVLEIVCNRVKQMELLNSVKQLMNFGEKINIINTIFINTKSLYINANNDPELFRKNIYEEIPPGENVLIYENSMYNLQFLSDMYNVKNVNTNDNSLKRCVESFLLINKKYNKYYCSCKNYSTIHIFELI